MNIYELTMLARSLSSNDVNVVVIGDRAFMYRDSGRYIITLPVPTEQAGEDVLYRGYLDHELGHVKFTDMDLFEKRCELDPELRRVFLNILEDAYVERRMGMQYPGAANNLRRLARELFSPVHVKNVLRYSRDWRTRAQLFVLYNRRSQLDEALGHSLEVIHKAMLAVGYTVEDLNKAYKLLETRTYCTQDNVDLAASLHRALSLHDGGAGQQMGPGTCVSVEVSDLVRNKFQRMVDFLSEADARRRHQLKNAVCARQRMVEIDIQNSAPRKLSDNIYGSLVRSIPPLLQSMQYVPACVGRKGALAGDRLWRTAVSDDRVFIRKAVRNVQTVEIILLMDCSKSMTPVFDTMLDAAHATYDMLKTLPKVQVAAYGFNGEFLMRVRSEGHTFFGPAHSSGSTGTGEALMLCLSKYTMRADTRRIMFLLTDGNPNCASLMNFALRMYKCYGIETYGIGMQGMNLARWFDEDHRVMVTDMNKNLAPMMAAMLKKALVCANTRQ